MFINIIKKYIKFNILHVISSFFAYSPDRKTKYIYTKHKQRIYRSGQIDSVFGGDRRVRAFIPPVNCKLIRRNNPPLALTGAPGFPIRPCPPVLSQFSLLTSRFRAIFRTRFIFEYRVRLWWFWCVSFLIWWFFN